MFNNYSTKMIDQTNKHATVCKFTHNDINININS